MRRRRSIPISIILVASVIAVVLVMSWPDRNMISRDIGCAKVPTGRGNEICRALSDSMQWTWMGHAIISPGWRVTWSALRRVYCRERIDAADLITLEAMKRGSDWRLQDGADELIRLVRSSLDRTDEPENSIFNPKNPYYILKNGCLEDR